MVPVLAHAPLLAFDQLAVEALAALARARCDSRDEGRGRWARRRVRLFSRWQAPDRAIHHAVDAGAGFRRRDHDRRRLLGRRCALPPLPGDGTERQVIEFEGDQVAAGGQADQRVVAFGVAQVALLVFAGRLLFCADKGVGQRQSGPRLADVAEDLRTLSELRVDVGGGAGDGDGDPGRLRPNLDVLVELPQVVDLVPVFEVDAVFATGKPVDLIVAAAIRLRAAFVEVAVVPCAGGHAGDRLTRPLVGQVAADRTASRQLDVELPDFVR